MKKEDVLNKFPAKRIQPVDGMAVTAEIWEEAHDYHRLSQQVHNLLSQGTGILLGLEVIASDPPDKSLYVMPGIAIDPSGETILIKEAVAYDLGLAQGELYLMLTYDESEPYAVSEADQDAKLLRIQTQFGLTAVADPADTPGVELARIYRTDRESPLRDAENQAHPQANEIDLRFRQELTILSPTHVRVGIFSWGNDATSHLKGFSYLAQQLRNQGHINVWIDKDITLDSRLRRYDLLYLVGHGNFEIPSEAMSAVYNYLQQGGTVFLESCRQGQEEDNRAAESTIKGMLESLGVEVSPVQRESPLLTTPHLFAVPPAGFETEQNSELLVGKGVILSTYDYGCLWQGEQRQGAPSRADIRAAYEWGNNLIDYVLNRRQATDLSTS